MTSTLKVDNLAHSGGTVGMTIGSNGDVTESNYVLEQWRLTTNEATNNAVVDNWERVDDATSSSINAGMTQSGGIFTFPSTGLWLVTAQIQIYIDGADGTAGALLQVSSNSGAAWDTRGNIYEGGDTPANQSGSMSCLVNVTNASTYRFQLATALLDTGSAIKGDTDVSKSALLFERKGPSQ